jgi:hypothetical protein
VNPSSHANSQMLATTKYHPPEKNHDLKPFMRTRLAPFEVSWA